MKRKITHRCTIKPFFRQPCALAAVNEFRLPGNICSEPFLGNAEEFSRRHITESAEIVDKLYEEKK